MCYSYGLEKMTSVVWGLASSTEKLHKRVHRMTGQFLVIEKHQLPVEAQCDYQAVRDFFERTRPLGDGMKKPLASLDEYRNIATKMCDIAFTLYRQKGESQD